MGTLGRAGPENLRDCLCFWFLKEKEEFWKREDHKREKDTRQAQRNRRGEPERDLEKKRMGGVTKGGKNGRVKEMGNGGQVTDQSGGKGAWEEGEMIGPRRGGRCHLSSSPRPSILPAATTEEGGREAGEEAEAAVTLETEPKRWGGAERMRVAAQQQVPLPGGVGDRQPGERVV